MKIGLIVAIEMDSIFAYYENLKELDCPRGFRLYETRRDGQEIYVLHTGMGEIAAAAGVQYLATRFGVDVLVNFGVVGGLTEEMAKSKVCVVERVVHYKYDCSEFMDLKVGQVDGQPSIFLPTTENLVARAQEVLPELKAVTCCSGDKFVGTAEEKAQLHQNFEGDVCDMESAGIVLTCQANDLPCLMLKAVSDGLSGGAGEFFTELQSASFACLQAADQIMVSL